MIRSRIPVSPALPALLAVLSGTLVSGPVEAQNPDLRPTTAAPPAATVPLAVTDGQRPPPHATMPRGTRAVLACGRVPIHTAEGDQGQAYGIWGGGEGFKASFHGDMTFVPYLGRDYPRNQPLSWHTMSARLGEVELAGVVLERVQSDYRYEYRFAGITEAYDVLSEGLEQTFVVDRLGAPGDLVITGEVTTGLHAPEAGPAHRALTFCDDEGNPVTGYGAAVAVDAAGNCIPLTTAYRGGEITLRVPGAWLERATLPVVVDPLLTPVLVSGQGGVPYHVDIGRDDESVTANVLMTYVRYASTDDGDVFARLMNDDYSVPNLVYADQTTSWSSDGATCAFVGGADKWVVALRRHFTFVTPSTSRLRVHARTKGDTAMLTNVAMLAAPSNFNDWRPDVGGVESFAAGGEALIVFQTEINGSGSWAETSTSRVRGVLFDPSSGYAGSFGQPFTIRQGSGWDCERPSVNQVSAGGAAHSWMCAMQVYDGGIAGDDWDLHVRRVDNNGGVTTGTWYSDLNGLAAYHQLRPVVEGNDGRYAVVFATVDLASTPYKTGLPTGKEIRIERFDWPHGAPASTSSKPPVVLATNNVRFYEPTGLGFDTRDDSHWLATWRSMAALSTLGAGAAHYALCGYNGVATESWMLYVEWGAQVSTIGCVYDNDADSFLTGYGSDTSSEPIWGRTVEYETPAPVTVAGQSCSAATITWNGSQQIGAELNSVRVDNHGVPVGHFLVVSLAPTDLPLVDPVVFPGCRLLVQASGPAYLATLPFHFGPTMTHAIALPEFLGPMTLHFQDWMYDGTLFYATRRLEVPLVK